MAPNRTFECGCWCGPRHWQLFGWFTKEWKTPTPPAPPQGDASDTYVWVGSLAAGSPAAGAPGVSLADGWTGSQGVLDETHSIPVVVRVRH